MNNSVVLATNTILPYFDILIIIISLQYTLQLKFSQISLIFVIYNRFNVIYIIFMEYVSEKKFKFKLREIANITIFEGIAEANLKVPKPPLYTTDTGQVIPNPFHPVYADALLVFDVIRHQVAFDVFINNAVELSDTYSVGEYSEMYNILREGGFISKTESLDTWYIKNYILTEFDIAYIPSLCVLTEQLVAGIFNSIRVTRDGESIHSVGLKNAINTNIQSDSIVISGWQLVSPLDEIRACKFSAMEWQDWLRCNYTLKEKATAVALFRLDRVIETHSNDVVQIHQERESKKKNKG